MKASFILAASSALLAAAGPILQQRKLFTEVDYVTDWVTVTVTGNPQFFRGQHTTEITSSSTPPPPPPEPTTSSTPPPPPPAPTTTEAPPPPPPAPTTEAAAPPPAPTAAPKKEVVEEPPASNPGSDYQSVALHYHNVHRFNHSAPELSWSDRMAGYAKATAQTCVFQHDMDQGGKHDYGQNLAMNGASNLNANDANHWLAVGINDGWYNGEVNKYPKSNYGKSEIDDSNFHQWGHFTAMVWKSTQQVGCYTQLCKAGTIVPNMDSFYTVCNYFPQGNFNNAYVTNVLAPLGQSTEYTST